jgi:hypothetical protein
MTDEQKSKQADRLKAWWTTHAEDASELSRQRAYRRYHVRLHVADNKPRPQCRLCFPEQKASAA